MRDFCSARLESINESCSSLEKDLSKLKETFRDEQKVQIREVDVWSGGLGPKKATLIDFLGNLEKYIYMDLCWASSQEKRVVGSWFLMYISKRHLLVSSVSCIFIISFPCKRFVVYNIGCKVKPRML